MMIYKILTQDQWAELQANGASAGAPVDIADGYIHFSTASQVAETAARHFAGQSGLMLAQMDSAQMGPELKWEPSRGGADFPHYYGPLRLDHVIWCKPMPLGPDGHVLPEGMI